MLLSRTLESFDYNQYYSFINLFEQQAKRYHDSIFIRCQVPNTQDFKTLSYSQVDRISTNLANEWSSTLNGIKTVGLIADHSIYYLVTMLAIFKLQPTLLALSPRNSVEANIDLMTKTDSHFIIGSAKYADAVTQCAEKVPGSCNVKIFEPFDLEKLSQHNATTVRPASEIASLKDIEKIVLIIHSSGSTAFPKPIRLSNRYMFGLIQILGLQIQEDGHRLEPSDVMLASLALFHVFGILCHFLPMLLGASCLILGRIPPTAREIATVIEKHNVTMLGLPPMIFEQIAEYIDENPEAEEICRRIKFSLMAVPVLDGK